MSTPNGDWAQRFSEFHERHKDLTGRKKLAFTAIFNATMDAYIACPDVPLDWRLLAYVWRYSWGNSSDHCVEKIGGAAIGQQHLAQSFQVDKRRVSDAITNLRILNFVRAKTGHRIVPVDDPSAPTAESPAPSGPAKLLFGEWCEGQWKSAYPADFDELQSAEATVNRIKKVRLGLWRQSAKERTAGMATSSPVIQPLKQLAEEKSSSSVVRPCAPTAKTTTTKSASPSFQPKHNDAIYISERLGIELEAAEMLLTAVHAATPSLTREDVVKIAYGKIEQIRGKLKAGKIENVVGFLITALPKAAKEYARNKALQRD